MHLEPVLVIDRVLAHHAYVDASAGKTSRAGDTLRYKAFISYSHAVDDRLAASLQSGLQQFARPWYAMHAMAVFRDRTDLSVRPRLWKNVQEGLDRSEYLILLASPAAARSRWIKRELWHWWETRKTLDNVLIVLTDGELHWDKKSFDWRRTTALPHELDWPEVPKVRALDEAYDEEPHWFDLCWARKVEDTSLRNPKFLDAVATIAATLRGVSKRALIGEDVLQHRRFRRVRGAVIATLAALFVATSGAALVAWKQSRIAREERDRTQVQRLVAESGSERMARPQRSTLLAVAALEQMPPAERRLVTPAGQALLSSLGVLGGQPLEGPEDPVLGVAAAVGGRWVLSWTATSALLHPLDHASPTSHPLASLGPVTAAKFLGTDRLLLLSRAAARSNDAALQADGAEISLWSLAGPKPARVWQQATSGGTAESTVVSPDGRWVIAAGRLWRVGGVALHEHAVLSAQHLGALERAVFLSEREFATAGRDRVLRWTLSAQDAISAPVALWESPASTDATKALVAGRSGRWLAAVTSDDDVHLWRLEPDRTRTWTTSLNVSEGDTPELQRAGFSAGDRWFVVVSDQSAQTVDLNEVERMADGAAPLPLVNLRTTREPVAASAAPDIHALLQQLVTVATLDEDGRWLAAGNFSQVVLWSLGSGLDGRPAALLPIGGDVQLRALAFVGDRLLAGAQDGRLLEWDMANQFELRERRGHELYINAILPVLDGRRLVTASLQTPGTYVSYEVDRREVRAWWLDDDSAGALPLTFTGLNGELTVAAFEPSKRWLVAGAGQGFLRFGNSLRLFDLQARDRSHPSAELATGPKGPQALAVGNQWFATADGDPETPGGTADRASAVRLFSLKRPQQSPLVLEHPEIIDHVAIDTADRWLLCASERAWLWDLRPLGRGQPPVRFEPLAGASKLQMDAKGELACAYDEAGVTLYRLGDDGPESVSTTGTLPSSISRLAMLPRQRGCVAQHTGGDGWLLTLDQPPKHLAKRDPPFTGRLEAPGHVPVAPESADWLFVGELVVRSTLGAGGVADWAKGEASADGLRWAEQAGGAVHWIDLARPGFQRAGMFVDDGFRDGAHAMLFADGTGRHLVTSDLEHIRIRDLNAEDPGSYFVALPAGKKPVAFAANGSWLIGTTGSIRDVALWPLDVEELLRIARKTIGRDLTPKERAYYGVHD